MYCSSEHGVFITQAASFFRSLLDQFPRISLIVNFAVSYCYLPNEASSHHRLSDYTAARLYSQRIGIWSSSRC